jgi:hypothetical protein
MVAQGTLQAEAVAPRAPGAPGAAGVRHLSHAELAAACRREQEAFALGQPSCPWYGYELFRRAIRLGDGAAWGAVLEQFRGTLRTWVRRHPARGAAGGDADDWADQAFSRFWAAVPPARFDEFPDLAALLRYLKLCLASTLADEARRRARAATWAGALGEREPELPDVAAAVGARLDRRELWGLVLAELEDATDRLLVYRSFVQALPPRAVHARHPERFRCVADVYRAKRNLLERLRRSPRLVGFAA